MESLHWTVYLQPPRNVCKPMVAHAERGWLATCFFQGDRRRGQGKVPHLTLRIPPAARRVGKGGPVKPCHGWSSRVEFRISPEPNRIERRGAASPLQLCSFGNNSSGEVGVVDNCQPPSPEIVPIDLVFSPILILASNHGSTQNRRTARDARELPWMAAVALTTKWPHPLL